jgi:hypothetical protein
MSSYTMKLGECLDMWVGQEPYNLKDKIEKGRAKLFDFDYPIFDPNYKSIFETHFIRKFYMREIGFETEGLFKFNLETWMLINMPYFNKLFQSELIIFDPLTNTKEDTTIKKTNDKTQTNTSKTDGTSVSTNNATNDQTANSTTTNNENQTATGNQTINDFNRYLEADTPDSRLNLTTADGEGVIEYASKIQENLDKKTNTNTSTNEVNTDGTVDKSSNTVIHATVDDTTSVTSNGNGTINEIEDYIQSKTGKIGTQSYSSMLNEYRNSILRVENKIFNEMQELFMLVY